MKCDSCKFMSSEGASSDFPYPHVWCAKGHWEGLGNTEDLPEAERREAERTWDDCKDFEKKG